MGFDLGGGGTAKAPVLSSTAKAWLSGKGTLTYKDWDQLKTLWKWFQYKGYIPKSAAFVSRAVSADAARKDVFSALDSKTRSLLLGAKNNYYDQKTYGYGKPGSTSTSGATTAKITDNSSDPNYALFKRAQASGFGGMSGAQVRAVQNYLNVYHHAGLAVDGVAGPKTSAAVGGKSSPTGTSSTGSTSGSGAGSTGGSHTGVAGSDTDVRAQYGALAWALDLPEIGDILRKAAAANQSPDITNAQIQNTSWWKTHSASFRSLYQLHKEDPKSYAQKLDAQSDAIRSQSEQLGIHLSYNRLRKMAQLSLQTNWDPQQLRSAIANEFHYKEGAQKGQAGVAEGDLREMAGNYAVPLASKTIAAWLKSIVAGNAKPEDFEMQMRQQAKSLFPSISDALDKGITVAQYYEPYRQIAAKTLEIDPDAVNLDDQRWAKALNQIDPKTGQRVSMSLSDWQTMLQTDQSYGYQKTTQARDAAYQLVDNLSKTYGVSA